MAEEKTTKEENVVLKTSNVGGVSEDTKRVEKRTVFKDGTIRIDS